MIFIMRRSKSFLQKAIAVVLALLTWQAAALLLNQKVLLASPVDVALRFCTIWTESEFFNSVWFTFSRIVLGFFMALLTGIVLAFLAGRFKYVEIILWPYMATIKSIPVASFIIIALIWLTSSQLSIVIVFLIVLPVIYTNILNGIKNIDGKILETATIFRLSWKKRLLYIWLPQIKPFIFSASSISIGLAWKSGVAAEIIGIPSGSIGEELYYSKVYLNTTDLFTWTVIIIILSIGFEKIFSLLLKFIFKGIERL